MTEIMPQEIEVWDILPAIRRELAMALVKDNKLSQREAARLLGITEPAVSQYMKSKRAKEVIFSSKVTQQIKTAAKEIVRDKKRLLGEIQTICNSMDVKKMVCEIHRKGKTELKNCKVCMQ
ncbi:MAG: transcriptional regulator [Candidatus Woesearchaeota archaeon]